MFSKKIIFSLSIFYITILVADTSILIDQSTKEVDNKTQSMSDANKDNFQKDLCLDVSLESLHEATKNIERNDTFPHDFHTKSIIKEAENATPHISIKQPATPYLEPLKMHDNLLHIDYEQIILAKKAN